jgi:ankyrin repeat protein
MRTSPGQARSSQEEMISMPPTPPAHTRPLLDAVWHADLAATRALLAAQPGAVNAAVYRQTTLLFFAARVPGYDGHGDVPAPDAAREPARIELIDFLVTCGADVNARNQRKVTPLHMAARYGLSLVAATLLRHGAEVNARDANHETPLYRAANLGHPAVARVLLDHGGDPNLPDRLGQTPLHRAVLKRHLPLIDLLLDGGADRNAADRTGNNPLQIALSKGHRIREVVERLEQRDCPQDGSEGGQCLPRSSG